MTRDIIVKAGGHFYIDESDPLVADDVFAYRVILQAAEDLTGCVLTVTAIRADGERVVCGGEVDGKTATATLPNNMYSVPRDLKLRLSITSPDGAVLTTTEIECVVEEGNNTDDAAAGDDRLPVLATMIARAETAANGADAAAQDAREATTEAETAEAARAAAENVRALSEVGRNKTFNDYIAEIDGIIEDAPVLSVNGKKGVVTIESVSVSAVLTADGWAGDGKPYTQTLAIEGLTAEKNGMIALAQSATYEQREAARDALLTVTNQADGALTVSADGKKPEIDIPVVVTLIG